MAPLPASVRVNLQAPFPSLVSGSAPVAISKKSGLWIVSLAASLLGIQNPPPLGNFATDQVLVWDSIAKTWIMVPMSAFGAYNLGRAQRSITGAGNLPILGTDSVLNFNAVADLTPIVPAFGARGGAPLTFKNLPGSHAQTLTRTAPDTIDGVNTVVLNAGASITLVPYNDGVNSGWAIE